ncbi:Protein-serine/threonine kinase [Durusdinium trenchii]|uniref:Protein-serine/threonine kinase n=1 Tax=Durusdinium trenchii TaxID=1381693 RepID=A0ABP0KM07_9DINO
MTIRDDTMITKGSLGYLILDLPVQLEKEDVKMQEQFVASLVKIEASARHAATSASASSSKVQGAEVIDLCDSVPDTDLEDEDDDTQEMMKNRPRLSKKLAHFLMAKKASTISELDDAIEVEVAALSMSTEEIRSEILRRLQLIPDKLWHKGPRRRPNVLRPEERRRGSNQLILGLITSGSFQKLPTISNETWMFPNLTKLILVYLDRLAKDQGWTKLPKGTTIQVTYNLETQLHVDGNNGGTSFGTSVGDHAGGKVFLSDAQGDEIWRLEEDIRRVGKEGDKIRGRRETTKDRLVEFDGNQIHGTCPFTGTRYAIILFGLSPSAVEETAELNKAYLTEMGFHYFDFVPRASERDLARRAAHDAAAGEDLKYEPPGKVPPPMRPHKRCTRQLQVIKEALRSWPSDSTDLALQEAIDFARRASNLQPGEPWGAQEVRSFGLRMMATHGLEAVDWPAGQWLSMLHIVDVPLPGRNSDRVSVDPLGREDAARLGKMAFQMLQAQLEQEMRRLGSSESSTTVLSPSQGSNASTSGTWQPQLPQIGPAGPYVQIVSNGQPGRRLKASPRHGERNMVRSHSEAPPAQPAVPMMRAVPASGLAGIELQLAQLKQEIVQERQERQALARLVETLIKDRPAAPKRRCDEKEFSTPGQPPELQRGFRVLEEASVSGHDAITEEEGDRTLDINFFRRDSPKGEASKPVDAKLGRLGPALPQAQDSFLADASAALEKLEEELGSELPKEPKGSPGFNLEGRDVAQDLQFYRSKCLELAAEVQKRDAELVQLRQALQSNIWQPVLKGSAGLGPLEPSTPEGEAST